MTKWLPILIGLAALVLVYFLFFRGARGSTVSIPGGLQGAAPGPTAMTQPLAPPPVGNPPPATIKPSATIKPIPVSTAVADATSGIFKKLQLSIGKF